MAKDERDVQGESGEKLSSYALRLRRSIARRDEIRAIEAESALRAMFSMRRINASPFADVVLSPLHVMQQLAELRMRADDDEAEFERLRLEMLNRLETVTEFFEKTRYRALARS